MLSPYWTISQIILSSLDSNQEIDTDSIKDNPGPILLEFSFGERDKKHKCVAYHFWFSINLEPQICIDNNQSVIYM